MEAMSSIQITRKNQLTEDLVLSLQSMFAILNKTQLWSNPT